MQTNQKHIVEELKILIGKGNAHVTFQDAVADLPAALRGVVPEDLPYSIWQLIEHVRIAQKDIVDFCESEHYEKLEWPADYWPAHSAEVSDEAWQESLRLIEADRQRFYGILENENADLFQALSWGSGQNLMREALLIADHNSYHTAEIVVIRRLLNAWH